MLTSSPLRPCTDGDSYSASEFGITFAEHLLADTGYAKLRSICMLAPAPLRLCTDGDSYSTSEFGTKASSP